MDPQRVRTSLDEVYKPDLVDTGQQQHRRGGLKEQHVANNLDLTPTFSFVSEDLSSILGNFSKQYFR